MAAGATGYLVEVFDLFNVGHLDLLRRAAESCDRLVVAVAGDDLVERCGGPRPFIPEAERLEIVSAVRGIAAVQRLDGPDLLAAARAAGADVVLTEAGAPDAVRQLVDAACLETAGLSVVRLSRQRRTASPAVQGALDAAWHRSSVA